MVRKLKFHEQKLLKKVDFINWDSDNTINESKIMRRFHVEKREHYTLYNKLSREVIFSQMFNLFFKIKKNFFKRVFFTYSLVEFLFNEISRFKMDFFLTKTYAKFIFLLA